jgi:hypothetical protein
MGFHFLQLAGDPLLAGGLAEDGPLAAIDVDGAQLAGVVHPEDFGQARRAGAGAGA